MRLHAYHTERVLGRSPALSTAGAVAGLHHERLDGSGYHRGAPAQALPIAARVLAAADVFQALIESRPHRPARPSETAAKALLDQGNAGLLDREAVRAVVEAAGHTAPAADRPAWPRGLTGREVAVLRLATRGASMKEIGGILGVTPKTVDHHLQHIYAKIGVRTRAGAAVFAMEHRLLEEMLETS